VVIVVIFLNRLEIQEMWIRGNHKRVERLMRVMGITGTVQGAMQVERIRASEVAVFVGWEEDCLTDADLVCQYDISK